jgi:hypothetical protein
LHYRENRDSCATSYLIKRDWAKKLISKHIVNNKFIFDGKDRSRLVADGLVYSGAICLSFPLLTYSLAFDSSINQEHVNTLHEKSHNEVLDFWKTKPKTLYRRLN